MKRVIIIVLDSAGCGEMPDSAGYGDIGVNTLLNIVKGVPGISLPNLERLGLYELLGQSSRPSAGAFAFGRMAESSKGKDTIIGHWELAGLLTTRPFPTYPDGFPRQLLDGFEKLIGTKTIGNCALSGTEIIKRLGREHYETGFPIVYTSADSVFQIAAHESVIPLERLYEICRIARSFLQGENNIARVIARPFAGLPGAFARTTNRKDFALEPPGETLLDAVSASGRKVHAIGKISDIFCGRGVSDSVHIDSNRDGLGRTLEIMDNEEPSGKGSLIFTNLVDFDMVYGHRRDVPGYARSLEEFDSFIPALEKSLRAEDIMFITADHGCDPSYSAHTDHTREHVPLFVIGSKVRRGLRLGTRNSFADAGKTAAEYLDVPNGFAGESFLDVLAG